MLSVWQNLQGYVSTSTGPAAVNSSYNHPGRGCSAETGEQLSISVLQRRHHSDSFELSATEAINVESTLECRQ
ncbi:hypothetical protein CYMTET_56748 [Cymbomonas tetramitiformis]|uniref:Uncharacterized protein n=1 Tax=Cymbomonas tetramitiformis TaxID=36881 RepID=A0AAE0BA92_9CHLO|nr:hypothetical protein CYMTET_56748 [Cymbomonas tetramitiformis]